MKGLLGNRVTGWLMPMVNAERLKVKWLTRLFGAPASLTINHSPSTNSPSRLATLFFIFCFSFSVCAQAQWLPPKPDRLVNDYSGFILTAEQQDELEQRLRAFDDSTSNQIAVVITPTLGGDDENAVAQRIGQAWGVGSAEFRNGVVILIKCKTPEEDFGAVAISTGYGVEGVLPDVFCKHIIDDRMLGPLGDGEYYRAINEALEVIMPVMAGEYSYAQYRKDERREALIGLGVLLLVFVAAIVLVAIDVKKHPERWRNNGGGGGGTTLYGGGGGTSSWWGHGGSSWSGGGSSWGGFGGGSFGGGGASGRF